MLGNLKYIKKYNPIEMETICREASIQRLEAMTPIFNQNDLEDYMYVIIKGKIACEICAQ